MPKRRNRPSNDIAELAAHFQQTWNDGQAVAFWLREHAEELFGYFRDGNWTWTNIGQALTSAGIVYRTGTPWTGENLRRNLNRALMPGKREIKLQRMSVPEPATPPLAAPGVDAAMAVRVDTASISVTPEFQLIRRGVDRGTSPAVVASLPPPRQARPTLTEEEIDAIAMGRSARR